MKFVYKDKRLGSRLARSDRRQAFPDFFIGRANRSHNDLAIPQKDDSRPQFDLKRSAKGFTLAVFHGDAPHSRKLLQKRREPRSDGLTEAAPLRAEIEDQWPRGSLDLFAGRLPWFGCIHISSPQCPGGA